MDGPIEYEGGNEHVIHDERQAVFKSKQGLLFLARRVPLSDEGEGYRFLEEREGDITDGLNPKFDQTGAAELACDLDTETSRASVLELASSQIGVGILVCDANDEVTFANEAFRTVYAIPSSYQIIGQRFALLDQAYLRPVRGEIYKAGGRDQNRQSGYPVCVPTFFHRDNQRWYAIARRRLESVGRFELIFDISVFKESTASAE